MSDIALAGGRAAWRGTLYMRGRDAYRARRGLQLALAGLWLIDAVLQFQPAMYTKAFSESLAATAAGNPGIIARPIDWSATLVEHHIAVLNTIFATIQLLLALGIAFRPTARVALGASVAWSVAVWWLGEGLGGVLNGDASPFNGAPGGVILYALLAVLLWPDDRGGVPAPFTAARAVGARAARLLWLVLWLSLAYFVVQPANRAPQALHDLLAGQESGEPGWLAAIERGTAALVANQGLAASIVLATVLVIVAVGVYLPATPARAVLVFALAVSAVIWVVGEACGMVLAGGATDPNSGPLLALLALAYWPCLPVQTPPTDCQDNEVRPLDPVR
ncbi:MAG: hypothetical protein ACRDNS_18035 [Trebonia sp.]